jgi:hypothetical protein
LSGEPFLLRQDLQERAGFGKDERCTRQIARRMAVPNRIHCPQAIHEPDGVFQGRPDPRCPFLIIKKPAAPVKPVDAKDGAAVVGFTGTLFTADEVEVDAKINGATAGPRPVDGDNPRQTLTVPDPRLDITGSRRRRCSTTS